MNLPFFFTMPLPCIFAVFVVVFKVLSPFLAKLQYEVIAKLDVIGESDSGWTKELRVISWKGRKGQFDLRNWSTDGNTMSKGISLQKDDLKKLRDLLNTMDLD